MSGINWGQFLLRRSSEVLAQLHRERRGHRPWRHLVWRCGTVGTLGLDLVITQLFPILNEPVILNWDFTS